MHNDVKQCLCGSNVHCGSCSHAVLMWLGRRVATRAIFLSFQIGQILRTFTTYSTTSLLALLAAILNLSVTTTTILPFGACYVMIHKAY